MEPRGDDCPYLPLSDIESGCSRQRDADKPPRRLSLASGIALLAAYDCLQGCCLLAAAALMRAVTVLDGWPGLVAWLANVPCDTDATYSLEGAAVRVLERLSLSHSLALPVLASNGAMYTLTGLVGIVAVADRRLYPLYVYALSHGARVLSGVVMIALEVLLQRPAWFVAYRMASLAVSCVCAHASFAFLARLETAQKRTVGPLLCL
eukprot:TRINITY_DN7161_c0_g1_i1.p1 TRINITY_DN7161_c0_g1~~TRINITY_DN7161_c0_g1_i1.p1  ORF type:complete len:207 (+),score=46.23 TRINITY_DN7161_c0_g1_i1:406-1026(+)